VPFTIEAVDRTGKEVSAIIDATTVEEATEQLHSRGLFVTRVVEVGQESAGTRSSGVGSILSGRPGNARDRMLLTQQMAMMLHAGSQVVPALTAIQSQIEKTRWRQVVSDVCSKVEDGASLSDAMAEHPDIFDETFRTILAAGESTGSTAEAFDRLAVMTKTQQEIKVKLISSLVYPVILLLMAIGVVGVLMFYVLPKFDDLYSTLGTELPWITTMMISVSRWIEGNQILVAILICVALAVPFLVPRLPGAKDVLDKIVLSLPLLSRITQRLILAKIFRVWGTLVRSNVPLLEGLRLSRSSTRNARFSAMMDDVIESVADGNSVGESLARHSIVPVTMSSAIATGEQSGQLGESLLYLADYLDQENAETIGALTRLFEPFILIAMGLVVGTIAISLFLPLFDLTSAVSGH